MVNNKCKRDVEVFDIEDVLLKNGFLDDLFYYKDLEDRKLYLITNVTDEVVNTTIRNIISINKKDKDVPVEERKPIILYMDTYGGDVASGMALIDAIRYSKTPVYTMNLACCYSMGLLIYIAGKKRFAFPNSRFLLHDGTECIHDSSSKAFDYTKFSAGVEKDIKNFVIEYTKISSRKYESNRRREWYMMAKEAKEMGIVDFIIGEDCDMDSIM